MPRSKIHRDDPLGPERARRTEHYARNVERLQTAVGGRILGTRERALAAASVFDLPPAEDPLEGPTGGAAPPTSGALNLHKKAEAKRRRRAILAGKVAPPTEEAVARLEDWRTPAERAADAQLLGIWWRCREHGPQREGVFVGSVVYCPAPDCTLRVLLAHSAAADPRAPTVWTKSADKTDDEIRVDRERAQGRRAARETQRPVRETVAPSGETEEAQDEPQAAPAATPSATGAADAAPVLPRSSPQMTSRKRERQPPRPASPAPAPEERKPPATGTTAVNVGDVQVRRGGTAWACAVCVRRSAGSRPRVVIVAEGLEVPVCAPCAAGGDQEMRAAAAPLLVPRSRAS